MTACKVLADEYEMAGQTDLATDLRKDAASMRMAPRKRVGMRESVVSTTPTTMAVSSTLIVASSSPGVGARTPSRPCAPPRGRSLRISTPS